MKFRVFAVILFSMIFVGTAFSQQFSDNYNGDILPRWQTLEELNTPRPDVELDELTPPPDNPVFLQPEYAPMEGIILRYPFSFSDMFVSMVNEFQEVATVFILVETTNYENQCTNLLEDNGVPFDNIEFIRVDTDAIWVRDYGPWFVEDEGSLSVIDLIYYWTRPEDDAVPEFLHDLWDLGYYGPNIDHEGGNMMTNGHGKMFMSTRVLDANPGMTETEVEEIYSDYFGQDDTYIFERIDRDATGHIDLWAKVMNDTTILVAEMQPNDVNYDLVEEHAATLDDTPTGLGGTFHIVRCPMPTVSYDWWYGYWYRSYLNSTLLNGKAVIPVYGLALDDDAIAAYEEALGPDWEVVGIDCNDIAPLGGAIHCVTIGVPLLSDPTLALTATPVDPPIIIGAGGGSFQWDAVVENISGGNVTFDAWTSLVLPGGGDYGPLTLFEDLELAAGEILTASPVQVVPGYAPGGTYTYVASVGDYPTPIASDEFVFEKTPQVGVINQNEFTPEGWELYGWEEEQSVFNSDYPVPVEFKLGNPYPNPFNPSTIVPVFLNNDGHLTVSAFNLLGQRVALIESAYYSAGQHNITFNAADLAAGIYYIHAQVDNGEESTVKVLLVK